MNNSNIDSKIKSRISSNIYYCEKIHNNPEFYETEKKRIVEYQNNRYATDEAFRNKKREYCKMKMRELYNKRKQQQAQSLINQD